MSKTVDDRVVAMKFDNNQFETGAKTTMSTLDKLKKALDFSSTKKGMDDLQASTSRFNLGNVGASLDGVSAKFLAMSTIGITALSTITSKAIDAGIAITKSLTLDPVKAGLDSYTQQINAAQTILANTASDGTTLAKVTTVLADLQNYANQTVFSFAEMTTNIGRFTAAGVKVDAATAAIKGMANSAALTGASTEQLNGAMYQMSQALASGTIRLMDWNSLANANLGTKNLQDALKATAMTTADGGKAMLDATTKAGNFRDSLQDGWLTADIFNKTMGVMAGTVDAATGKYRAFTVAELVAQGYAETQAESLNKLSQAAIDSAIKIRTIPQLMAALKEEVATAWGSVFKTIFGDLNQATDLFSGLHNIAENALTSPIYALNKLLTGVSALGGREVAIEGIKNAFQALGSVLKPIKDAFREIFPATAVAQINSLLIAFDGFAARLKISGTTAKQLKDIFAGVFAALDIGKQIILGILGVIGKLISVVVQGSGGVLDFAAHVGRLVVAFDLFLKKTDSIKNFFSTLGDVLAIPLAALGAVKDFFLGLFDGWNQKDADGVSDSLDRVGSRFDRLKSIGDGIKKVFDGIGKAFGKLADIIAPIEQALADALNNLGDALANAFKSGNFDSVLDAINTALFGGILLLVAKFFKKGINVDLGGGFLGSIKDSFETLTGTMKAMQTEIKADTLLKIAGAIALLTLSVVALSLIDSDALTKALTAMAVGFGQLLGSMAILAQISGTAGFVKIPIIAASMDLLAASIVLLSGAIVILSRLSWEELAKGLIGVSVGLGLMVGAMALMPSGAGTLKASIGIGLMAGSLVLLAGAVALFGNMDWDTLGKGLGGVAVGLGLMVGAMKLMPAKKGLLSSSIGILVISGALVILAVAVSKFGNMDWETLGKGLLGIAAAMTILVIGLNALDVAAPGLAAFVGATAALVVMAGVVEKLGNMKWSVIGKGLGALYVLIVLLVGAMAAMEEALPGAVAMIVAAGAVRILADAMKVMSSISWEGIGKGFAVVIGLFVILAAAAILMTPILPMVLLLGLAVLLLGTGLLAAGTGMLLFSAGITALAAVGQVGIGVITAVVLAIIALIPKVAIAFAQGFITLAQTILDATPGLIVAGTKLIMSLLEAIIILTPEMVKTFEVLVRAGLQAVRDLAPEVIQTGIDLVLDLLNGIAANADPLATAAENLVIALITAIASKQADFAIKGWDLVAGFIEKMGTAALALGSNVVSAALQLGQNIIDGILDGLGDIAQVIFNKLKDGLSDAFGRALGYLGSLGSPSKKFMVLGKNITDGVTVGIEDNGGSMASAMTGQLDSLKAVMEQASKDIPRILSDDFNPTITPVLDLSGVTKQASGIASTFGTPVIAPTSSFDAASGISASQAVQPATVDTTIPDNTPALQFTQINQSPKALSTSEIYRNTKNLISVAKEDLSP